MNKVPPRYNEMLEAHRIFKTPIIDDPPHIKAKKFLENHFIKENTKDFRAGEFLGKNALDEIDLRVSIVGLLDYLFSKNAPAVREIEKTLYNETSKEEMKVFMSTLAGFISGSIK